MTAFIGRREFITLLGGAAAAWPLAARAQQPAMPVIGFLDGGSPAESDATRGRIPPGPGRNRLCRGPERGDRISLGARVNIDRLPALAAELVRRQVAVIVVARQHRRCARGQGGDHDDSDRLRSRRRPGRARPRRQPQPAGRQRHRRHLSWPSSLGPKRLELLRELVPEATHDRRARQPDRSATMPEASREMAGGGTRLGLQIMSSTPATEREIETAFAALRNSRAGCARRCADPFFTSRREQIVALAARHAHPDDLSATREYVEAGGLMSYGAEHCRRVIARSASMPAAFSRATKPADLPVDAADQVRAGHQPQDRQGARPRRSADAARPRRRGDRMSAPGKAGAIQPVEVRPK